ncbi:MAG: 3-phosphoshikimate 1-carboxyvinyltransferase [Frankiales bacterium]|nr:3-phosphoshikimate 1-carboxyvinyltransferase [Frankiales bacterium]
MTPLQHPPSTSVRPPGSKSITNRALLCAVLAEGVSTLSGALFADDTEAMIDAVRALGAELTITDGDITVRGIGSGIRTVSADVDCRKSGTTSRFILPAVALSSGRCVVDGGDQLRARPFGPLLEALASLGAHVESLDRPGYLPVAVTGPALGGRVSLPGHLSSQFLSGLLMAAPLMADGLEVELVSPLVSVPYVEMTGTVMRAFGVESQHLLVRPQSYLAVDYAIEPDASAASYFLAAAAITGGRITVEGLGTESIQGDVAFADLLEQMGAHVVREPHRLTVTGTRTLHGIDVDMADISDTAQTLAAVAVFADSPTVVRGIGFIRGKETDRIGAIVTELQRAGIDAVVDPDGFTINPGPLRPTRFRTYDDHRMAMSLALIGLRQPGIEIEDPGCVVKTYPDYFTDLAKLG